MARTADYLNKLAHKTEVFYQISEDEGKKLKEYLLEMYQDVTEVCNKYNLCIMLSGGSALGAVRHKGFIPWDDDLDAMMPRKDYNKLIEVFDKELGDKYIVSVPQSDRESGKLFMEIIKKHTLMVLDNSFRDDLNGIKIDIFPIETVPENKFIRRSIGIFVSIFRFIVISSNYYRHKTPIFKSLFMRTLKGALFFHLRYFIGMIFSVFPRKYLFDTFDKFVSGGKGDKYCSIPSGRKSYNGEALPRNVFFPPGTALFEGVTVAIPNNADVYLRNLYGNYMEIPPPEKRERHFFVKFSLDTTSKETMP